MDRTTTFNSVTLKNTQTEPQKYIFFFKNRIKKITLEIFFYLPENNKRKVLNQIIKKSGLIICMSLGINIKIAENFQNSKL